ncbi:hypothetical protein [Kitasatospora sp. NPDC001175]|uniref:hypothetical protein n=1 Tax=Kitasatospora sp. NPDC001175 TaxID=3157103 RepID=UPI003CFF24C4
MAISLEKPQEPSGAETSERPKAFGMPDLTPYVRGGGSTIRALGHGSAALSSRLWSARKAPKLIELVKKSGIVSWGGAFCTACGAVAVWKIIGPYISLVATGSVALWAVAALMHSRPAKALAEEASEAPDAPSGGAQEDAGTAFLHLLHELLPKPDSRLHLAQIAEALTGNPKATSHVRTLCAATGVTITDGVRVPDRGVSTGIYGRHVPPLPAPSPTPPVGVVVAGQNGQQQQQHLGEGLQKGFTTAPDPNGDPRRTIVHWHDQTTRRAS